MARPLLALLLLLPLAAGASPPALNPAVPRATLTNGDVTMSDTLTGRWIVTEVAEITMLPDIAVTMDFAAEGGVSGHSGCNSYGASLDVDGLNLSPGPARSSKKACSPDVMAQEAAFHRALERLSRYEIAGDGTLVLYGIDTVMLKARRE